MSRGNSRARGATRAINRTANARRYERERVKTEQEQALQPITDMLIFLVRIQLIATQPKKGEKLDPETKQLRADMFKLLKGYR